ncbi:MAG: cupredoxin domain-containing protein [Halomonas sp.]|nr:cupredoxin domain-containing protein [Halomonas sp.]
MDIGQNWRRLAAATAVAWAVWATVLTIVIGGIEPFVLIFAVVPILAWVATRWKPNRITYTIFGVVGILVILLNLPFVVEDLAHPESAFGFNITTWALLTALTMILVAVRAWRSLGDAAADRILWGVGALFLIGLVVSVVAALGLEDDERVAGDLEVVAEEVEFVPETLTASAGDIGVFIDNRDPGRHTFTIEELGIDQELPANTARRVSFDAPAGTYEYICTVPGHEDMKGTLTVGG